MLIQVMLCNSALNIDIGHFILKQLCPMIYAVLADGLRTNVRSLFGKMKNCVWNVVEATATQGQCGQPCSKVNVM